MTKREFFTQLAENKILTDFRGAVVTHSAASQKFWHRNNPGTWRLSDFGYWNLRNFDFRPFIILYPELPMTPNLILKMSKLTRPWYMYSAVTLFNSTKTELLMEFAIFGDKEVMWLELCGRDLVKFLDTMIT